MFGCVLKWSRDINTRRSRKRSKRVMDKYEQTKESSRHNWGCTLESTRLHHLIKYLYLGSSWYGAKHC